MARTTRKQNIFEKLEKIEKLHKDIEVNKPKRKKTLIYSRLSSVEDKKDMTSIENQVDICNQYINEFNNNEKNKEKFEILNTFMDNGYTGANMNRPEFIKMYDLIRKGEIDTLIVKDLSRIGRNYIDVGQFINDLVYEYNVEIIAVTDNFFSRNIEDRNELLMFAFKNIINDFFREDIRRKIIKGITEQLKQGIYRASYIYGYKKCDGTKRLIINKEEATVVKKIFDMRIESYSCKQIADILNKLKIKPSRNNSSWNDNNIYNLLDNYVYTGNLKIGENTNLVETYIIENSHEPIISKEIFEKANSTSKYKIGHYGFSLINGTYNIKNDELEIITKIFNYGINGYSGLEIADILNSKKILYKNERWTEYKIKFILKNKIYIKKRLDTSGNIVNPLIEKSLFLEVKKMIGRRPYGFYLGIEKQFIPIKEELVIVSKIYEERAKGESIKKICNLVKSENIVSVKQLSENSINRILNNRIYETYQKENELEIISDKILEKVERLKFYRYIPYGYIKINNKLIECKTESEVVKLIFELRSKGKMINEIIEHLEERKTTPPKNKKNWNYYSVRKIIQDKSYIGVFKSNYYLKDCILPKGIIQINMFNKANKVGGKNG